MFNFDLLIRNAPIAIFLADSVFRFFYKSDLPILIFFLYKNLIRKKDFLSL